MVRRDLSEIIRDPRLLALYDHWRENRRGSSLPARMSLDPVKIPKVLSIIFVCDYEPSSGRLRYRLAGEDIAAMYSEPLRGRYQDELFPADRRSAHLARVKRIMSLPAIAYSHGDIYGYGFSDRLGSGERLGLPLANNGRDPDAIVGATA